MPATSEPNMHFCLREQPYRSRIILHIFPSLSSPPSTSTSGPVGEAVRIVQMARRKPHWKLRIGTHIRQSARMGHRSTEGFGPSAVPPPFHSYVPRSGARLTLTRGGKSLYCSFDCSIAYDPPPSRRVTPLASAANRVKAPPPAFSGALPKPTRRSCQLHRTPLSLRGI